MNILILSCGTRNKIVQYFKKTITGKGFVIATDMSELAPALYEADKHYIVPRMTEPGYLDIVLDICKKESVSGILSLVDPELSLISQHIDEFRAVGTTVIGSSYELCERSLDKFEMYKWLVQHGYNCARSFIEKAKFYKAIEDGNLNYPVFVKPVKGSASVAISKVYDKETVELLFTHSDGLLIQEFLDGQEIGADVYVDLLTREVVSIFTKKKILMRAGETDKAVSFKDEMLFTLIKKFVKRAGYSAQIDIDIFEINGEYYISEVNPRFGGGYPHAYECGVDHMTMILNNLSGVILTLFISVFILESIPAIVIGICGVEVISALVCSVISHSLINYKLHEQISDTILIFIAFLTMGAIIYCIQFIQLNMYVMLLIQICVGVAIYWILSLMFKLDSYNYLIGALKEILKGKVKTHV